MINPRLILSILVVFIVFEAIFFVVNQKVKSSSTNLNCQNLDPSKKLQCFEDLTDQTLQKEGLDQAFLLMGDLFEKEPIFTSDCHSFAHKLGEKAYDLFSQHKNFTLSAKSSYCGYGFYHGFMETLLHKTGSMEQARQFCAYADTQLKETTSDAGGACYHGIGHGIVDGSDPRTWGNAQAMIDPALSLCEKVSSDEIPSPRYGKLFRCISGAFNALEILIDGQKYQLTPHPKDPFAICRTQPNKYKEACYTQFVVAAMQTTKNDFDKTAQIISTIAEDEYAIPALQALVVERTKINGADYSETVIFCHNLASRFQLPCITGFGEGFLKYGPPQTEYIKAVDFCSFNLLTDQEKQACFNRILSILRIWYTAGKSQQICQAVTQKYQWNKCQYN